MGGASSVAAMSACVRERCRCTAQARGFEWRAKRERESGVAGNRQPRDRKLVPGDILAAVGDQRS